MQYMYISLTIKGKQEAVVSMLLKTTIWVHVREKIDLYSLLWVWGTLKTFNLCHTYIVFIRKKKHERGPSDYLNNIYK